MYYVKTDYGVRIAVYDLNAKGRKTVFFLHGWPLNHEMFEYQFNVLPKLGYRCISMDLRGFGNSDAPWDGYDYNRLSDDVYEVIRTLNVPQLTLVGFSMGGAVAIRYMARHRGYRVKKLALVSAAAPSFVRTDDFPYGLTKESVDVLLSQLAHNRPQAVEDFSRMFFASKITDSFFRWFTALSRSAAGHSTIHTLEALRDTDLHADLRQIRTQTGIFYGALDKICPYPIPLELSKGILGSTLFRFDQSGHGVFYDEMDKFNEMFLAFLNG
ncbi:alpha/beta fold hydrolase [Caproiciproducens sp. LBM24188]|nr:alpha/beta hydrolase [Oscillospiraceae bacterium]HHV32502.1 alpha/beta hydrolase [Clostridiales bacterium]